jgi:LysR family glycine cleavage system transcriptional activator
MMNKVKPASARRHIPLNAVRAFEAAARHMSVARAANELCVTPTAVSHQIRTLEEYLQVELFERGRKGLALTRAAAGLVQSLTEGLDTLDAAFATLSRHPAP